MSGNKFQGKYRISSARHLWHDYNDGLYFITICTKGRECYFGGIAFNAEIIYSEIGKWAVECIENISNHFKDVEIPVFVVMPNHIHLIIAINEKRGDADCRDAIYDDGDVNTTHCRDAIYDVSTEKPQNAMPSKNEKMQSIANQCGRLSHVISNFKSVVTRYANQNNIQFGWQSRFHDHIIRNQDECNRIADYIENNPYNWASDRNNDDSLQSIVHSLYRCEDLKSEANVTRGL